MDITQNFGEGFKDDLLQGADKVSTCALNMHSNYAEFLQKEVHNRNNSFFVSKNFFITTEDPIYLLSAADGRRTLAIFF